MRFLTLLNGLGLAASTVAQISTGQACPADSVSRFEACVCPYGTEFQYSTTWAILGVNAKDFSKYTSSFYNLAWIGATNLTRNGIDHGPDKKVGTTRTFNQPTSVGTLTFTEKLDSFQTLPDGSYVMRFSLFNVPVEYKTGKGSFGGYWVTLDAEYAGKGETVVKWDVYACLTDTPFNFAKLHIDALNGILKVLDRAGLVKGNSTGPYYVQTF
ncbi:MAG: hypothetical protein HETSPECPRED_001443 [Heterodermia speciosa]|uniref:Uncharacterized protein n=1 Tax=Heterodermia speciosa TaxID=116794 RepID=A0A8H3PF28_9LECA|nr:MAG: hypothetical protein HETSPECPRED_001443 [Heterodermia speciosa]